MRKQRGERERERKLLEAGWLIRTQAFQQRTDSGSSRGLNSVDESAGDDEEISAYADRRKINLNVAGFCMTQMERRNDSSYRKWRHGGKTKRTYLI